MAGFVKIAKSDEIQPGQGKMVEVDGKKIALFIGWRAGISKSRFRRCEILDGASAYDSGLPGAARGRRVSGLR